VPALRIAPATPPRATRNLPTRGFCCASSGITTATQPSPSSSCDYTAVRAFRKYRCLRNSVFYDRGTYPSTADARTARFEKPQCEAVQTTKDRIGGAVHVVDGGYRVG
jgi:hypothetical protein